MTPLTGCADPASHDGCASARQAAKSRRRPVLESLAGFYDDLLQKGAAAPGSA